MMPPFEDRVPGLLRDAAAGATPTRDPVSAFRAQQRAGEEGTHRRHQMPPAQRARTLSAAIGAVVLVALFAATFTLGHGARPNGATSTTGLPKGLHVITPTPFPTFPPNPTFTQPQPTQVPAKHIQLRRDQITLTVVGAYAFPTRTAIWLRADYDPSIGGALSTNGTLTGAGGYSSLAYGPDWGYSAKPGAARWSFNWHLYADPLPSSLLHNPQTLTLTLSFGVFGLNANDTRNDIVDGTWPVTFTVTPQVTQTRTFTVPAQTSGGITIRPISWEGAPTAQQFDPYPQGGGRLVVEMSGFPAHTLLRSVGTFEPDMNSPWGSSSGPSSLSLWANLPIGEQILSLNGGPPPPQPMDRPDLTEIGPHDAVRISIVFYQQFPAAQSTIPLKIADLQFNVNDGQSPKPLIYVADGPWNFDLPWE